MFENSKWICSEKDYGSTPVVYFRDLNIIYPLKRAVLHISADGIYNVYVGKDKAGDVVFASGRTAGSERFVYQSYDITELVAESDFLYVSVVGGQHIGDTEKALPRKIAPGSCGIAVQIDLEFAGGLCGTIVSDEGWTCGTGNILESDIHGGEIYDASIKPVFEDAVKIVDVNERHFSPQETEYMLEHGVLEPKSIFTTPKGETVIDFGTNITGYPCFERMCAKKGERVDLSFCKVLDSSGNFCSENCKFTYLCSDGEQSYKPHHALYNFRYIRVNSFPDGVSPEILRVAYICPESRAN